MKIPTEKMVSWAKERIRLGWDDQGKILSDIIADHPGEKWDSHTENDLLGIVNSLLGKQKPKEDAVEKHKEAICEQDEEFPPEILQEARDILSSPDVHEAIKPHLDNIIVGEDSNKQLVFNLLLSGKSTNPKDKQIIVLKGDPGGGKSALLGIADLFKTKTVGRFSQHALDYSNLSDYEVLRLKELGSMDKEDFGVSTIKFLSPEDDGYTVEVTIKDEKTGKFKTETYKIPAMTLITSTIRVSLDKQFERRGWLMNPDESGKQTLSILKFKADNFWQNSEQILGIRGITDREYSKQLLKALISEVKIAEVVTTFPKTLADMLESKSLRVRGDVDKLFALIKFYAVLEQSNLPKVIHDDKIIVFPTPDMALKALKLAEQPLVSMSLDMDERSRMLLEQLKDIGKSAVGDVISKTDREAIAVKLGLNEKTILRRLGAWVNNGCMVTENVGKSHETNHKLLYSLEDIEKRGSNFARHLDCPAIVTENMRLEALNHLSSLDKNTFGEVIKYFSSMPKPNLSSETVPCEAQNPESTEAMARQNNCLAKEESDNTSRICESCNDFAPCAKINGRFICANCASEG